MTEEEYASIAAACDRRLRAADTSLARLAIPALHFLNEHPSSLAQYRCVLSGRPLGGLAEAPGTLVRAARALARAAAGRPPLRAAPADVVIVSHLLRPEQLQQDQDFYFGALQDRLQDQGATSLLVLISHLPDTPQLQERRGANARVVLPGTVALATEARIWREGARAWRALSREAAAAGSALDTAVARLAGRQAVSSAAAANLRMHAALADLCRAVAPKMVITTYEGTVAERLIWHAARDSGRRPLCVGYQHAMILRRAHAIRRPVAAPGLDCDPDVILTLGPIPQAMLASSPELRAVRFIQYGSHRRATLPALPAPHGRPRSCLVLPDASHPECVTLFDFALRCARRCPDLGFILRPHPMVDTGSLRRRLPALASLPGNVVLSADRPLEQDLAQARYCLYRGSSAALHAVRAGIRPYYLARTGELPFDCLHALHDWRECVTAPEEFIDRIDYADAHQDCAAGTRAAELCERHVAPLRPEAVQELLALVPSGHGA
ncbi:MAG TPA: hypothetical protein VK700_04015 [Steroidobacteraceae bacterium]|jgi:hypothetical protein|nr:hypothetical protein [Steroidobacteraceae bacterium]